MPYKSSKFHKAARALQKAWIKSAPARSARGRVAGPFRIFGAGSRGDDNQEKWVHRSRDINRNWNQQDVPYYMRKGNKYRFFNKKKQRWT